MTRAVRARPPVDFRRRYVALRQIGTFRHDVNGAAFATLCRMLLSPMERQRATMDRFIDQIVRRSIRHAQLMLKQGSYNWPVARLALRKILSDLEAKAPDDPSLARLRAFIALKDRGWMRENG